MATKILQTHSQFVSTGSASKKGVKGMVSGWKERSKTFQGIADAMAKQWGTSERKEILL